MTKHRGPRLGIVAAAVTVVAVSLAGAAAAVAAAAAPTARTASPAAAPTFSGRLYGIAATSPSSIWGVGLGGPSGSLIVHWNGKTWSEQASAAGFFEHVAAADGTAWAVGGTGWFTTQPLIERWNGKAWIQVQAPTLGLGGYLNGVAIVSASNAWAVGQTGGGPGDGTGTNNATLVVHWNGRDWTRVPSPAPPPRPPWTTWRRRRPPAPGWLAGPVPLDRTGTRTGPKGA